MVTKQMAMSARYRDEFVRPHRTIPGKLITVRVNGACKVWKTRPTEFRLPVKYGLRECGYIDHDNAEFWSPKRG